jgi:hypothetical protein
MTSQKTAPPKQWLKNFAKSSSQTTQSDMLLYQIKIAIVVNKQYIVLYRHGSNEAICTLADCDPFFTQIKVKWLNIAAPLVQ